MKPAKEFLMSLHMPYAAIGDRFTGGAVNQILARDIEVLEEAARLVCVPCGDGRYPTLDTYGRRWHSGADCKAWPIHDRIAELKKELADGTG